MDNHFNNIIQSSHSNNRQTGWHTILDDNLPTNTQHTTDKLKEHITQMSLIFDNAQHTDKPTDSTDWVTALPANMNSGERGTASANRLLQIPNYQSVLSRSKRLTTYHSRSWNTLPAGVHSQPVHYNWLMPSLFADEANHKWNTGCTVRLPFFLRGKIHTNKETATIGNCVLSTLTVHRPTRKKSLQQYSYT